MQKMQTSALCMMQLSVIIYHSIGVNLHNKQSGK